MKKNSLIKNFIQTPFLSFVFLFLLVPALSLGQIAAWSPASLTAYGPSPWASTTTNANLTVGGLTRGSGVGTSGTAAGAAWGTMNTANVATSASAVTSNQFVTFSLKPNTNYVTSLSTFDLNYRRSASGPASGLLQYAINAGSFVDIATLSFASTSSSGASITQVSLSSITALQSVPATSTLNFRIVLYGNTTVNGTWYVFNTGMSVGGTVVASSPIISSTGTLSSLSTTYGTASAYGTFNVSGTNMTAGISINPPAGFEVSTTNDFSSNVGSNGSPISVGFSGTIPSTPIYIRLKANASAGNYNGNIVLSSAGASNVNVATNASNTVSQKGLTISGLTANDKTFDNSTTATLSGTAVLNGVLAGDTSNVTLGGTPVANFNDVTVGTNKPITVSGYSISGSASANYSLSQPTGLTANINASSLINQTITFGALSPVTYGDGTFNLTATSDSGLTVTYTSSNTNVATVSANVVTIVGAGTTTITASQAGNSTYNPATDVPQSLIVNQKTLTLNGATASSKVYDGFNTAIITGGTLNGIVGSDSVSFSGNGTFDTANVGISKTVTGALVLNGTNAGNYTLTQPVLNADISVKGLTISGISISNKQYDNNNTATITGTASLVGVVSGDVSNVVLGGTPIATFGDSFVGTGKSVTISGYALTGSASGNYSLTQPSGFTANITTKSLTIVGLTADNKTYDRDTTATLSGTATLNGVISGDELNISLLGTPSAAFATYSVGTGKTVNVSGYSITGSSLSNYTLTPLTLTANITKKDVSISGASASDKTYDGSTTSTLSGTLSGVISPDVVTLTLNGSFADANVGTNKPVTSNSTISGTDALNYNLVQPTGLTATIYASLCGSISGIANWDFATANPTTNTATGVTVSSLSQGHNNGTTSLITATSASSGYTGYSGTNNAGAAAFTGALNTSSSTYFEFTVTPLAGYDLTLNGVSFASRSTSTGPLAFTVRSNKDGYTSNVATGSLVNTGTWVLYSPSATPTSSVNSAPITFRLYGHSGTGTVSAGTANWRIDDLKLNITMTPGRGLSSSTTSSSCSGSSFTYAPTSNYIGATFSWTRAAVTGISNTAITTPQTSNPNEILINTTSSPVNVIYTYTVTTSSCFVTDTVTVTVNPIKDWYLDADNDGYYVGSAISQCDSPGIGYRNSGLIGGNDCDDSNALVYQSGLLYIDVDGDHYTVGTPTVVCYGATVPTGYSLTSLGTDCDDTNALVNPGHAEILYNGIDDNCDGQIDEGHQIVTQLLPSVCGTTIATMSSSISATVIQNATGYRFKVTNNATSAVQIIDRTNAWFSLNQLPVYDYAASYSVQVQVQRNGIWLGYYGPACTIYSPGAGPSSSGTIAIVPTQCGQTLPLLSTIIYTNGLAGVTGWRYRITNTSTNQVQILDRAFSWFSMKMLPSYTYGVTYTVEVAVKTSGDYSAYGSACNVTMPPVPSLTAASCGATMSNSATVVYTSSLDMVTTCRFELTNMVTNQVIVIDRPVSWFNFSMVPNYTASTQYGVRVAVMTTGVFSGYGEACLVTSPGTAKSEEASQTPVTTVEDFKVMALPNPFSSNFGLTINTTSDAKVEVKIYDMIGKLLEVREIQASEIDQQSIGERYPSGVYNVIVTQGENIKTLRVIKR